MRLLSSRFKNDHQAIIPLNLLQKEVCRFMRMTLLEKPWNLEERKVCPLCPNKIFWPLAEKDRYGLPVLTVVCADCGMIFSKKFLKPEPLETFYSHHYRLLHEGGKTDLFYQTRFDRQIRHGKRILSHFEKTSFSVRGKTVFEIGCGSGGIVQVFSENGFQASGCDLDPDFIAFGKNKGLDLTHQSAEQLAQQEDRKYDVVILRQVLEHVPHPSFILRTAKQLLKPGGVFYCEVPGIRPLSRGKKDYDFLRFLLLPHVLHFDNRTFQQLLEREGFSIRWMNDQICALCNHADQSYPPSVSQNRGKQIIRQLRWLERKKILFSLIRRIPIVKKKSKEITNILLPSLKDELIH